MFRSTKQAQYLKSLEITEEIPKDKSYINITTLKVIKNKITFENIDDKNNYVLIDNSEIKTYRKTRLEELKKIKEQNRIMEEALKSEAPQTENQIKTE